MADFYSVTTDLILLEEYMLIRNMNERARFIRGAGDELELLASVHNIDLERAKQLHSAYLEVKPFEYWPNGAMTVAHNICEWDRTKNYYYITQAQNLLYRQGIPLTPVVSKALDQGQHYLITERTKGSVKTAHEKAQLEGVFFLIANLMYKREGITLAMAAHYAATAYKGIYKASTLQRKYSEQFAKSQAAQDLYCCIDAGVPYHYDHWTAVIEQLELDPELEGTRR